MVVVIIVVVVVIVVVVLVYSTVSVMRRAWLVVRLSAEVESVNV